MLAIKQVPVDTDLQEIIKEISIMQQCDSPYVVKYYGSYFKNTDLWVRAHTIHGFCYLIILRKIVFLVYKNETLIYSCYLSQFRVIGWCFLVLAPVDLKYFQKYIRRTYLHY